MDRNLALRLIALFVACLTLAACNNGQGGTNGYAYECAPAEEIQPDCQKMWMPTAIDYGESVSLGFSSAARMDLESDVDYRHDEWEGENIAPDSSHPDDFARRVVSDGVNDGNAIQMLQRMEATLDGKFYTVILMNAVTHDISENVHTHLAKVPLDAYRNAVEGAAQLAEQHAAVVIWINTPPIPAGSLGPDVKASEVGEYNAAADQIAAAHGFYTLTMPGADHIPGGNVHYTSEGYDLLGRQVAACVITALADQSTAECHR